MIFPKFSIFLILLQTLLLKTYTLNPCNRPDQCELIELKNIDAMSFVGKYAFKCDLANNNPLAQLNFNPNMTSDQLETCEIRTQYQTIVSFFPQPFSSYILDLRQLNFNNLNGYFNAVVASYGQIYIHFHLINGFQLDTTSSSSLPITKLHIDFYINYYNSKFEFYIGELNMIECQHDHDQNKFTSVYLYIF